MPSLSYRTIEYLSYVRPQLMHLNIIQPSLAIFDSANERRQQHSKCVICLLQNVAYFTFHGCVEIGHFLSRYLRV